MNKVGAGEAIMQLLGWSMPYAGSADYRALSAKAGHGPAAMRARQANLPVGGAEVDRRIQEAMQPAQSGGQGGVLDLLLRAMLERKAMEESGKETSTPQSTESTNQSGDVQKILPAAAVPALTSALTSGTAAAGAGAAGAGMMGFLSSPAGGASLVAGSNLLGGLMGGKGADKEIAKKEQKINQQQYLFDSMGKLADYFDSKTTRTQQALLQLAMRGR